MPVSETFGAVPKCFFGSGSGFFLEAVLLLVKLLLFFKHINAGVPIYLSNQYHRFQIKTATYILNQP